MFQCTWTNFYRRQKIRPTLRFYISFIWHTRPDLLSELLFRDQSRRDLIVGLRHSDFLSDWSWHTWADFLSHTNSWIKALIFERTKGWCIPSNFYLNFHLRWINRAVCAGHYYISHVFTHSSCWNIGGDIGENMIPYFTIIESKSDSLYSYIWNYS